MRSFQELKKIAETRLAALFLTQITRNFVNIKFFINVHKPSLVPIYIQLFFALINCTHLTVCSRVQSQGTPRCSSLLKRRNIEVSEATFNAEGQLTTRMQKSPMILFSMAWWSLSLTFIDTFEQSPDQ